MKLFQFRILRKFGAAREGVAAVEFAMILPLMLTMWLGTVEIGQAIAVSRKIVLVSRTLADLTARATSINNAGMTTIFAATTAVLYPFQPATLAMRVSSIKRMPSNATQVVWSDVAGIGLSALPVGSNYTLPMGILTAANQTVIVAEARYLYSPAVAYVLPSGGFVIDERTFMVPRLVQEIPRVP